MSNENDPNIGRIIANRYEIKEILGEGSFFKTYRAEYLGDSYAIKFGKTKKIKNTLEILFGLTFPNIPFIKEVFLSNNEESYIVMQLVGKDISTLKGQMESKKFSIKTVAMIGYQILHILEIIHREGIVHRSLGESHIVIGHGDSQKKIFLIGFHLATKFKDNNGNLPPMKSSDNFSGMAYFASINALKGFPQTPRDDLESLGYILLNLLKGKLPWKDKRSKTSEERKELAKYKESISAEELCKGLPQQMKEYIEYCRNLEYDKDPDYKKLKKLCEDMITKNNEKFDYIYDWSEKNDKNKNNFINFEEIENLKIELNKKDKTISDLNDKIKKIGSVDSVEMIKKIEKLQADLDNLIAVHFVTCDKEKVNVGFTCKLTDKFDYVEKKLMIK